MAPVFVQQSLGDEKRKPNVLFIMVDDLKPELGCYGEKHIISPNIDRLASRGMVFKRAYCQEAICMSSRNSLLSGYRPDTAEIWTNRDVRNRLTDIAYLPKHFRDHGYYTVGMGKIFHGGWDDKKSWSEPHWIPENAPYEYRTRAGRRMVEKIQQDAIAANRLDPFKGVPVNIRRGMPYESLNVKDNELGDGQIADYAIEALRRVKGKQFFMGVGFLRPHLPFVAPKKYWDMYDPNKIQLASNPSKPKNVPQAAMHNSSELRMQYRNVPKKGQLDVSLARNLIHGYYACVSYVDAQIGRVLDELERLGMADDTIVVLCGDHGWHLGDHGMWCKHSNFEAATRTPLIISAPGMKARGGKCSSLVELVGIYPTLCELADLPLPAHLEGSSFSALLDQPQLKLRETAFSQYPRGKIMGYSMRTEYFRYTEWRNMENSEVRGRELYDYRKNAQENANVVDQPQYSQIVENLTALMKSALINGVFK
ncbi:MAG: sulfatase [Verrucomicrobia bacterium]|nr:sulfatase [Verrucomicrobiota bacterium]